MLQTITNLEANASGPVPWLMGWLSLTKAAQEIYYATQEDMARPDNLSSLLKATNQRFKLPAIAHFLKRHCQNSRQAASNFSARSRWRFVPPSLIQRHHHRRGPHTPKGMKRQAQSVTDLFSDIKVLSAQGELGDPL